MKDASKIPKKILDLDPWRLFKKLQKNPGFGPLDVDSKFLLKNQQFSPLEEASKFKNKSPFEALGTAQTIFKKFMT